MNFFTAGAKMMRDIDRLKKLHLDCNNDVNIETIENQVLERNKRAMRYGIEIALAYKQLAEEYGLLKHTKCFMITIRPECKKINFHTFKHDVEQYLERRMFTNILICSYEQKGTSIDTLGHGFHVHIIAETTCRSKGEVLKNTISSFNEYVAPQCIQVDLCKDPEKVKQDYLIDYKSNDGHKIKTKIWDEMWRASWEKAPSIKSVEGSFLLFEEGEEDKNGHINILKI